MLWLSDTLKKEDNEKTKKLNKSVNRQSVL